MSEPKPESFKARVLVEINGYTHFEAVYEIENNKAGEPVNVLDVELKHCVHGAQDYLKEAAFHASLVEAGK